MNNMDVLKKGFITKFVLLILLVFVVFSSIASVFLYFNTYWPLNTNYSASISIISEVKEELFVKTLTINAVFYLFIVIGIVMLAVLYTHRIAGPLHRIKLFARSIASGNLTSALKFRKNDAIHSFGDSLNRMTESWRGRVRALTSYMEQLENTVKECSSLAENREETVIILKKISSIDNKIKKLLKEIYQ